MLLVRHTGLEPSPQSQIVVEPAWSLRFLISIEPPGSREDT